VARGDGDQEHAGGTRAAAAPPARGRVADRREGKRAQRTGLVEFVRECWAELQRVEWPDRRHLTQATIVVLVFCFVLGVYIGVLDAGLSRASQWLIDQYASH
jgi:preprotein translocase subunit SecE